MEFRSVIMMAASLLLVSVQARAEAESSRNAWHVGTEDGKCRISWFGEQFSRNFSYIKSRDGRYEIRVSGPELMKGPQSGEPLLLHFGDETLTVGGSIDPIMPNARPPYSESEEVRLFEGLEFFEASVASGPKEQFALDGISDVKSDYLSCIGNLASSQGPPQLLDFTGIHQLTAVANRQHMLGEVLRYTLNVAKDGEVTDCTLSRKFRRKYVTISFCRVLMEHHKFAPARNADGEAVAGTYTGAVNLIMPIKAG